MLPPRFPRHLHLDRSQQGDDSTVRLHRAADHSVFPRPRCNTSATTLTPDGTLTLNYVGLISPIVKSIQALSTELATLESTVAGFAQSITTNLLHAQEADVQKLCVGSTCVTPQQFASMVAAANQAGAVSSNSSSTTSSAATSAPNTPPTIQINGDNPAIIQIGSAYNDLGATITGPQADLNLDIKTFLNGPLTSNIVIDTSAVATDTIGYVVTDQNGLTSTTTRMVKIEPRASPALATTAAATTTQATTTSGQ